MDITSLYKITYGLYVVSSMENEKTSGCVVNTLQQVTNAPNRLSVTINKDNYTTKLIEQSGLFSAVVLTQEIPANVIGLFGFQSGADVDKYGKIAHKKDENGIPYLTDGVCARYTCKVIHTLDLGTHVLFVGELQEAEVLSDETPLTYAYYRNVIKGGTPKNAPSYQVQKPQEDRAPVKKKFTCKICGYVLEADALPADFICPICGAGPESFEETDS